MLECVVLLEEEWEGGTWKGGEGGMTEGGREGGKLCLCVYVYVWVSLGRSHV